MNIKNPYYTSKVSIQSPCLGLSVKNYCQMPIRTSAVSTPSNQSFVPFNHAIVQKLPTSHSLARTIDKAICSLFRCHFHHVTRFQNFPNFPDTEKLTNGGTPRSINYKEARLPTREILPNDAEYTVAGLIRTAF